MLINDVTVKQAVKDGDVLVMASAISLATECDAGGGGHWGRH